MCQFFISSLCTSHKNVVSLLLFSISLFVSGILISCVYLFIGLALNFIPFISGYNALTNADIAFVDLISIVILLAASIITPVNYYLMVCLFKARRPTAYETQQLQEIMQKMQKIDLADNLPTTKIHFLVTARVTMFTQVFGRNIVIISQDLLENNDSAANANVANTELKVRTDELTVVVLHALLRLQAKNGVLIASFVFTNLILTAFGPVYRWCSRLINQITTALGTLDSLLKIPLWLWLYILKGINIIASGINKMFSFILVRLIQQSIYKADVQIAALGYKEALLSYLTKIKAFDGQAQVGTLLQIITTMPDAKVRRDRLLLR